METLALHYRASEIHLFQSLTLGRQGNPLSRQHKLELTQMKVTYARLHQELAQFTQTGNADYLQVVWKQKLRGLCDMLTADRPSWLAPSVLARLNCLKASFKGVAPVILPIDRTDRALLADVVLALLQHWDSYIEGERPRSEDEVLTCMALEGTSMKCVYRDELQRLGMTSFRKKASGPFLATGNASPAAFYGGLETLLWRWFGVRSRTLSSVVLYRTGSSDSLGTTE